MTADGVGRANEGIEGAILYFSEFPRFGSFVGLPSIVFSVPPRLRRESPLRPRAVELMACSEGFATVNGESAIGAASVHDNGALSQTRPTIRG